MEHPALSRLQAVDIRKIWKREPDFSAWLAQSENLTLLGEALDLEMEADGTEASAGDFSIDILAHDTNDDRVIIIENQYGTTNHDHLGKLITYASGRQAKVLIWIVEEARDEHRSAVQWLNEHTGEDIAVFLVKITVYRIGASAPAPQFTLLEQPNDWQKSTRNASQNSELGQHQRQWWADFSAYLTNLKDSKLPLKIRKPQPNHWSTFSLGTGKAHISSIIIHNNLLGVELYIPNNKTLFDKLSEQKETIEQELGFEVEWQRLDTKKASRIIVSHPADFDVFSTAEPDLKKSAFEWYKEKLCAFYRVFHERCK